MKKSALQLSIAATFIWAGFILAISFMEAWIKFRAPGITLPLGLGIGQLVFAALNRVELFLSLIILGSYLFNGLEKWKWHYLYFLIPFALLLLQSIWLLPVLDARAEVYVSGNTPEPSNIHFLYIIFEFVKVVCLLGFGFIGLRKNS